MKTRVLTPFNWISSSNHLQIIYNPCIGGYGLEETRLNLNQRAEFTISYQWPA